MKLSALMHSHGEALKKQDRELTDEELQAIAGSVLNVNIVATHLGQKERFTRLSCKVEITEEFEIAEKPALGATFWVPLMFWAEGYSSGVDSLVAVVGQPFLDTEPEWADVLKRMKGRSTSVMVGFRQDKKDPNKQWPDHEFVPEAEITAPAADEDSPFS